jgi:thiamine kinase-like enzyme
MRSIVTLHKGKNIMIKNSIKKVINHLELGALIGEPEQVFGGLLHKMYKVGTSRGVYAVKALNPIIMKRELAISNTIFSEKVAKIALDNKVPAVVSHKKDGCIHDIDGSYFMVFDWVEAKNITQAEVTMYHCKSIGKMLAQIHSIDFAQIDEETNCVPKSYLVNWQEYCGLGTELSIRIERYRANLEKWTSLINQSILKVCTNQVISHRDMDYKNVLWDENGSPFVIDWESAGYINPLAELIDVALAWSGMSEGNPDEEKFKAVISSYLKNGGAIDGDIKAVLDYGYIGKLEWLEYSIKRAIGIESSDKAEQELGREQANGTLKAILDYEQMIPVIEDIFKTYIKE